MGSYLDDLALVPLGIALVIRMIPEDVLAESRVRATELADRPTSRGGAIAIVTVWLVLAVLGVVVVARVVGQ